MRHAVGWFAVVGVCIAGCGATPSDRPAGKALTRRDPEPAGSRCANGGTAISVGSDRNGDGVLEDDEIEHTDYVCDAATRVLIRKDPIAPEPGCPTGGIAVQTGVDSNGDGILQDAEIQQTTRLCSPAELWEGDFTAGDWADPRKVAALQGVRVVAGTLVIDVDAPVSLPMLVLVTRDLHVRTDASPVELPALIAVDGNVSIDTAGDIAPSLALLERVGGELFVAGSGGASGLIDAPALREVARSVRIGALARSEVSVPGLRAIGGDLEVSGGLTALRLDGLHSITGGIELHPDGPFGLDLPSLETIGGALVAESEFVTELILAGLEQLGGDLRIEAHALTRVSIPTAHRIGGDLLIRQVPSLVTLELGTTDVAGAMLLRSARALATLSVPRLARVLGDNEFSHGIEVSNTSIVVLDFPALREVHDLRLELNSKLEEVRLPVLTSAKNLKFAPDEIGFPNALAKIVAPEITHLDNLIAYSVRGLELGKLTSVTDTVAIVDGSLSELSGLHSLTSTRVLRIWKIDQLKDLRSLASIREVGAVQVLSSPMFTSLDGLETLTDLPVALELDLNPALASLAALRNVTRIGFLKVEGDAALRDLALPNLTTIDLGLWIITMPSLQDLSGLGAVRSVGGEIMLLENDNLSDQEIQAFLHQIGR